MWHTPERCLPLCPSPPGCRVIDLPVPYSPDAPLYTEVGESGHRPCPFLHSFKCLTALLMLNSYKPDIRWVGHSLVTSEAPLDVPSRWLE